MTGWISLKLSRKLFFYFS